MKNLKNLIAIGALLGATHGANAFEKNFEPVEKGDAEAQGIELINGQLLVKSKDGRVGDIEMPYTFIGTNTANFAGPGFAIKEMADANSLVLNSSDVYFTRASDVNNVYRMAISDKPALNGVTGQLEKIASDEPISSVLTVKEGVIYGKDATGNNVVELNSTPATIPSVTLPESTTNNLYSIAKDGHVYVYEKVGGIPVLRKYNSDAEIEDTNYSWGLAVEKAKEMVVFDDDNSFILSNEGVLYRNSSIVQKGVSGIKASKDGDSLLITSQKDGKTVVEAYDTTIGEIKPVYSEGSAKKFFAKKEVKSNGLKYYVNGKKIGYSIAD